MQCCVPNCPDKWDKTNKYQNKSIFYREFPKDPYVRFLWVQSLGVEDWQPKDQGVVCSRHFWDGSAVPVMFKENNKETTEAGKKNSEEDIAKTNICRICLCTDRQMHILTENDITQQYAFLTASQVGESDKLPKQICWECKARLASFARLRSLALRSLEILQMIHDFAISGGKGSAGVQLIIDRDSNNLKSTLVQGDLEVVEYSSEGGWVEVYHTNAVNTQITNIEETDDNLTPTPENINYNLTPTPKNTNDNLTPTPENTNDNLIPTPGNTNDNIKSATLKNTNDIIQKENEIDNIDLENDKMDSDNYDLESDNTDEDEEKSDVVDYKSGLEDMIYDSDNSKSEDNEIDINLYKDLAKINHVFHLSKLVKISKLINREKLEGGDINVPDTETNDEFAQMFSITFLSKDEQLKEVEKRKESDKYKNAGLKCDICYKGFVFEHAHKLHMAKHSDVSGPHKCPICGFHFKFLRLVRSHLTQYHEKKYSCKKCDFVTGLTETARSHVKFHKGTVYKCSQCDRTFLKYTSYLGHVRIKHPSDFVCRLCGYSFISKMGLRLHTKKAHFLDTLEVPEDGPRCVECDIQFSTDTALTTHYQESNKHKDVPHGNTAGGRYYAKQKKNIKKKNSCASAVRVTNCEYCDRQFENHMSYHWHLRREHPGKTRTSGGVRGSFMCETCGKCFRTESILEEHRYTHTDIHKYSCHDCGKQFKTKVGVTNHVKTHFKRQYECDICKKTFSTRSNVWKHKILHQGLHFDCKTCNKRFYHPQYLHNHIKFVHEKSPWPKRIRNRTKNKGEKNDRTDSPQMIEVMEVEGLDWEDWNQSSSYSYE